MKLSPSQLVGLAYYAHKSDKAAFPAVRNFSHDPRVISALLDKGAIEPYTDGFTATAGPVFRITEAGLSFMRLRAKFPEGRRVQLHPGTDQWMRGDRFGEVRKVADDGLVHVKMDRSGKTLKCKPDHILDRNPETDNRLEP